MKKKIFTLLFLAAFAGKTCAMNDDNFFISEDTSLDDKGFENLSTVEHSFDFNNHSENKNQFSNFSFNDKEEEMCCKMHDKIDISKYIKEKSTKLLNPKNIDKITDKIINLNIEEDIKTDLITKLLENNEKLNEKYLKFISEFDKNNTFELKTHKIAESLLNKGMVIDFHKLSIEDTNNNIENYIFQIKVESQFSKKIQPPYAGNTCGPRALFNCYKLAEYFDQKTNADILDTLDLLKNNTNNENKKIDDNKKINVFLDFASATLNKKPTNLTSFDLEKIIKTNEFVKDIFNVLEGYSYSFGEDSIKIDQTISIKEKNPGFLLGLIIKRDESETGLTFEESASSIDHWICLFLVKISNNKYAWFIADSLNKKEKIENNDRVLAYIHKFLGKNHEPYEKHIEKNKIKAREKQDKESFYLINNEIKSILDNDKYNSYETHKNIIDDIISDKIIALYNLKSCNENDIYLLCFNIIKNIKTKFNLSKEKIALSSLHLDISKIKKCISENSLINKKNDIKFKENIRKALNRIDNGYEGFSEEVKNKVKSRLKLIDEIKIVKKWITEENNSSEQKTKRKREEEEEEENTLNKKRKFE